MSLPKYYTSIINKCRHPSMQMFIKKNLIFMNLCNEQVLFMQNLLPNQCIYVEASKIKKFF